MTLRRLLLCSAAVILAWHVAPSEAFDRTRSQFERFFWTFETFNRHIIYEECSTEFADYRDLNKKDDPAWHRWSVTLLACVLDKVDEIEKATMAVTGILFALLPVLMAQVGPSVPELVFLSTRRPILAALLGYGSLSPNPTAAMGFEELEEVVDKAKKRRNILPNWGFLNKPNFLVMIIISGLEYAIALAAAGNCFYQIWRLTYRGISVAPIVVYAIGIPESATLFGWAALNLPVHVVGFLSFALAFRHKATSPSRRFFLARWIVNELTPCAHGTDFTLVERTSLPSLQAFTGALTRLAASLHIILGTVLLGSVYFVVLNDSLPIIYAFVAAGVGTRLVLEFELLGLAKSLKKADEELSRRSDGILETKIDSSSKATGVAVSLS